MDPTDAPTALDTVFPATSTELAGIRRAVGDVASEFGADEQVLPQIKLAVTEAATNAILHAYRNGADTGELRVTVQPVGDGAIDICVSDNGVGMAPRSDSPGLGLGLSLMAHETDRFQIQTQPDGGTEIVLHFQLTARAAA